MTNNVTIQESQELRESCVQQLESLGIKFEKAQIALYETLINGESDHPNGTFKFAIEHQFGLGFKVSRKGIEKSCLISYEAMANIADAMGLFDQ